jgi:aspartyl-tRNA(Asn)/glutamyl-tRNA(Gln) amidotransferase subunit C
MTTTLKPDEIRKIAHMARIKLSEHEIEKYADLNNILKLAEQIEDCNVEHIVPLAHPQDIIQRLRNDEITETNNRDELQKTADNTELGLYLVEEVIE